jgi:hypothetical protein
MSDILTKQIIQHLKDLSIIKKKAILELIKEDISRMNGTKPENHELWRNSRLTTSVWSVSEIDEINKAREYINQWKPEQFF